MAKNEQWKKAHSRAAHARFAVSRVGRVAAKASRVADREADDAAEDAEAEQAAWVADAIAWNKAEYKRRHGR